MKLSVMLYLQQEEEDEQPIKEMALSFCDKTSLPGVNWIRFGNTFSAFHCIRSTYK